LRVAECDEWWHGLGNQRFDVDECVPSPFSLIGVLAQFRRRPLPPSQEATASKSGNFAVGDGLGQIVVPLAPQTTNDVVDAIAPRIRGYMVADIVTLNFPLSNFALLWTASARTATAVLAEGFEVVVRHWRRNESKLHEDNAGSFTGAMAGTREIFPAEIKVATHNFF
jgi:hypothetical protein